MIAWRLLLCPVALTFEVERRERGVSHERATFRVLRVFGVRVFSRQLTEWDR